MSEGTPDAMNRQSTRLKAYKAVALFISGFLTGLTIIVFFIVLGRMQPPSNPWIIAVASAVVIGFATTFSPVFLYAPRPGVSPAIDGSSPDLPLLPNEVMETSPTISPPIWRENIDTLVASAVFILGAGAGHSIVTVVIGGFYMPAVLLAALYQLLLATAILGIVSTVHRILRHDRAARLAGFLAWLFIWGMLFFSRPWIMNAQPTSRELQRELIRIESDKTQQQLIARLDSDSRAAFNRKNAALKAATAKRARRMALILDLMPYAAYPPLWKHAAPGRRAYVDLLLGNKSYDTWIGSDENFHYPSLRRVFLHWSVIAIGLLSLAELARVTGAGIRRFRHRAASTGNPVETS